MVVKVQGTEVLRDVLDRWKVSIDAQQPERVAEVFTEDAIFQGLHPYSVGRQGVIDYYASQPPGMTVNYRILEGRQPAAGLHPQQSLRAFQVIQFQDSRSPRGIDPPSSNTVESDDVFHAAFKPSQEPTRWRKLQAKGALQAMFIRIALQQDGAGARLKAPITECRARLRQDLG